MRGKANRVRFGATQTLCWPQLCVLCLKPAKTEDAVLLEGGDVPYCDDCYAKVRRLRSWKDSLFMVSLLIGVLGAVVGLIGVIVRESWVALFKKESWLAVVFAGLLLMGIAYILLRVILLPLQLILRSKVGNPGVKVLKSKEPGVTVLKFSNPKYAEMFRKANNVTSPKG